MKESQRSISHRSADGTQNGGFIPWDQWKPILHFFNCPCCMGVQKMPTEEELEQRITEMIDRDELGKAIRDAANIQTLNFKGKGGGRG